MSAFAEIPFEVLGEIMIRAGAWSAEEEEEQEEEEVTAVLAPPMARPLNRRCSIVNFGGVSP